MEVGVIVFLGFDIEILVGILFFVIFLQVDVIVDLGYQLEVSIIFYIFNEMEICLMIMKNIGIDDNEFIVGSDMGGDVYVGGVMNFIYGIIDEFIYDIIFCSYFLDKGFYIFFDGFVIIFIYFEW